MTDAEKMREMAARVADASACGACRADKTFGNAIRALPLPAATPDKTATALPDMGGAAAMREPSDEEVWLIWYEDQDRKPELFSGCGATEAAKRRYEQLSITWNCHLFRKVSPSIDKPTTTTPDKTVEALEIARKALAAAYPSLTRIVDGKLCQEGQLVLDALAAIDAAKGGS